MKRLFSAVDEAKRLDRPHPDDRGFMPLTDPGALLLYAMLIQAFRDIADEHRSSWHAKIFISSYAERILLLNGLSCRVLEKIEEAMGLL